MAPVGFESTISAGERQGSRMGAPYIYDISRLRVKISHTVHKEESVGPIQDAGR